MGECTTGTCVSFPGDSGVLYECEGLKTRHEQTKKKSSGRFEALDAEAPAHDEDVDGKEEQTSQPDVDEDVPAAELEQVGGGQPQALGAEPGGGHGAAGRGAEIQTVRAQRQPTDVPHEVL